MQKSESIEVCCNLPKETQNPSDLLGSWHNQFGIGLQDGLTGMAVWVLSWRPQSSGWREPKKKISLEKPINTYSTTGLIFNPLLDYIVLKLVYVYEKESFISIRCILGKKKVLPKVLSSISIIYTENVQTNIVVLIPRILPFYWQALKMNKFLLCAWSLHSASFKKKG